MECEEFQCTDEEQLVAWTEKILAFFANNFYWFLDKDSKRAFLQGSLSISMKNL